MVVVAIIALLALMTVPLYLQNTVQQQVKDAVVFAAFMKTSVAAYYAANKALPADNAAAGLPAPEKVIGTYVTSATVVDGAVTLLFGNSAVGNLKGKKLTLRPGYVPDAPQVPLSWVCGPAKAPDGLTISGADATDIPKEQLPMGCRG